MKKNWTDSLKDKMQGYEIQPPEELWNDISHELFQEDETKSLLAPEHLSAPSKKSVFKHLRRFAVAAVFLAVFSLVSVWYGIQNTKTSTQQILTKSETPLYPKKGVASPLLKIEKTEVQEATKPKEHFQKNTISDITPKAVSNKTIHILPTSTSSAVVYRDAAIEQLNIDEKPAGLIPDNRDNRIAHTFSLDLLAAIEKPKSDEEPALPETAENTNHKRNRISWGPVLNSLASNSAAQSPGYPMISGTSTLAFAAPTPDNPYNSILLENRQKEVETNVRHQTPQTYGFAVLFPLSNRWNLTSGISYSLLKSELTAGSISNHWSSTQKLHYLGIPLSVQYKIGDWNRFSAYASSGVFVQKLVAGTSSTTYTIDNQTQGKNSHSINEKPLQFSVNTGLGIRYQLYHNLGIFAEPGLGYYFDNHSPVENVYKKKQLGFNFRAGLQFTVK